MSSALLVYCTFPSRQLAENTASSVVERRLAACATLAAPVHSTYRWQGKICSDEEYLLTMKTTTTRFVALRAQLLEDHPYDCPEIIAVDIRDGHQEYLQWIKDMTED